MNRTPHVPPSIEPERYELREPRIHYFELQRRDFFKAVGGGIAILVAIRGNPLAAGTLAQRESGRPGGGEQLPQQIGAWLHVGEDGRIKVFTGKVEMGQNIRTSLSQAVADELRVPVDSIELLMDDTDRCPFDMGTFGSRTTPTMAPQLRRAAAAARDTLIGLAAAKWNVDRNRLIAEDGQIREHEDGHGPSGRAATYAELAAGQKFAETIPPSEPLTPAEHWTIEGVAHGKVSARDFVTGRHRYTSDLRRAGMLYGKIVRPASFGATLISVDASAAKAMPGVTCAVDGDFIGVAAPTLELAEQAAEKIRAEWKPPAYPSTDALYDYLKNHAGAPLDPDRGSSRIEKGSTTTGLAAAAHRYNALYTAAYIAHAPLEPRAALAEWKDGALTVWTGTQRPFGVRSELAQTFGIPEEKVRVQVPDTGSAYGGKHTGECAVEAARLARAAGRPVKLVWSREEEFTWAYFRPAARIEISSGTNSDGILTAWVYENYNSGTAGIPSPYDIPNQKIQFHPSDSPLRQGSHRGLAATANHFARESHTDEIARDLKIDPLEFRRRHIKDLRLLAVFEAAAKKFSWGTAKTVEGQGFGIAGGVEKGGYVATCAEARVDRASGEVKVARMVTAFECGAIVNPKQLENQIEGAMIMGVGGALFESVKFSDGKILNPHFRQYRVPRFRDVPQIEIVMLDRKDIPSAGAGETPIVGVAPAIGNAIFDASGLRLRALPLVPSGLKQPA